MNGNSRPVGSRIVKRLRPKSTTAAPTTTATTTTTIAYDPQQFTPATARSARVSVRTRTVVAGSGLIESFNNANSANNGNGEQTKRRVVIKKLRPKSSTASPQTYATDNQDIITASTPDNFNNNYNNDYNGNYSPVPETFTTLKVEEVRYETPATTPKPFNDYSSPSNGRNLTATVGGFKVTVISKSSDQQTSTSNAEPQSTPLSVYKAKASFPKLNKKLITGGLSTSTNKQQINQQQDQQISSSSIDKSQQRTDGSSTQTPDYDYSYYNTDDESQYVAEHNSPDRLYGKKARNKVVGVAAPAYEVGDISV